MAGNLGSTALKTAGTELFKALGNKAIGAAGDKVSGLTEKLEGIAGNGDDENKENGSGPGGGSSKATKATNIIEQIDVGVPIDVAYNQWTEFGSFPSFMKKVEQVETDDDEELEWKAQILWSHRTWKARILEQVPDERIVWRSSGEKGHVDGSVTFHDLGPNLTRIIVVLEYYPQGLFERTGNIWRAQGRRVRAELKHFQRHVMTRTILEPDEVEGWRGTIEDGEVVESHEEALEREDQESGGSGRSKGRQQSEDEDDQPEDEYEDDEPEDEYDDEEDVDEAEDEYDDEPEDDVDEDEPEDEYDDEEFEDDVEDEPEDEYEDDEPEDDVEDEPEDEYDDEPEDEYEDDEPEDDVEDEPEDEYEDQPEDEYEDDEPEDDVEDEPEDEYEDQPEDEYEEDEDDEEPEDEYEEDDYDEGDEEDAEEAPRRSSRRRAS